MPHIHNILLSTMTSSKSYAQRTERPGDAFRPSAQQWFAGELRAEPQKSSCDQLILSVQCLQTSQRGMKTHIAAPALVPNKQRFVIISQLLHTRNVQAAVAGNSTQSICDGVGKQAPVAAAVVARERNHRSTDGVLGLVRMDGRAVLPASVSEETPRSCVLLSVYVPSGASSQRRRHRSRRGSCRSRSRTRCGGRRGSRARSWGRG